MTPDDPTSSYSDPTLLPRQRERWPLAIERANRKVAQLQASGDHSKAQQLGPMILAARNAPTVAQRVELLHRAASTWSTIFAPLAACRAGCAHCCRMSTLISRTEAERLAKASGRPIAERVRTLKKRPTGRSPELDLALDAPEIRTPRTGVACPFLVDERCSVYNARPLACRQLLNMDDDNLLCQHADAGTAEVPLANGLFLNDQAVAIEPDLEIADLRDFFPPDTPREA